VSFDEIDDDFVFWNGLHFALKDKIKVEPLEVADVIGSFGFADKIIDLEDDTHDAVLLILISPVGDPGCSNVDGLSHLEFGLFKTLTLDSFFTRSIKIDVNKATHGSPVVHSIIGFVTQQNANTRTKRQGRIFDLLASIQDDSINRGVAGRIAVKTSIDVTLSEVCIGEQFSLGDFFSNNGARDVDPAGWQLNGGIGSTIVGDKSIPTTIEGGVLTRAMFSDVFRDHLVKVLGPIDLIVDILDLLNNQFICGEVFMKHQLSRLEGQRVIAAGFDWRGA